VITLGIIYLSFVLLKTRWKRMAEHKTLNTVLNILVGWGVVFFGIYAVPIISDFWKLAIDGLDSLIFLLIGIAYFQWQKKQLEPKTDMTQQITLDRTKKRSDEIRIIFKKSKLSFWLFSILEAFEVFFFFFLVVTGWSVYYVLGVAVVTFGNLILIGSAILGFILFWDLTRRVNEYRSQKRKKTQRTKTQQPQSR
jgi:hypothetical protein